MTPEEQRTIPGNFQDWLRDEAALPLTPAKEGLVNAVNRWIRENPGVPLPDGFVREHISFETPEVVRAVCETPRSLSEFRGEDK